MQQMPGQRPDPVHAVFEWTKGRGSVPDVRRNREGAVHIVQRHREVLLLPRYRQHMTDESNLNKELKNEDDRAGQPDQSGKPERDNFSKLHGDDTPGREPVGGPPEDNTPPPPDDNTPFRQPTENPTDTSPNQ